MHLAITDSGLGGLSICAGLERHLSRTGAGEVRITYVNAWPEQHRGYNDFPDIAARAGIFDRVLDAIAALGPDRLVIACNTLSIVYADTHFSRGAAFPVLGIVDAGVALFREALDADADSSVVLMGTKTTIESGVHRDRLVSAGIDATRIVGVSCHGLATLIEASSDETAVARRIDECAAAAAEAGLPGRTLYAGLCCTHYGYVGADIAAALARHTGRTARALDPNRRLLDDLARDQGQSLPGGPASTGGRVLVEVLSKVELDAAKRQGMARRVRPESAATADALLSYTRVPGLF